jgi:hypothetical protein
MRSNRRGERRPAKQQRLGPMVTERVITDVPSFLTVLHRFGIVDKTAVLGKHGAWSEYLKVQNDLVVTRIRERLSRDGELRKGSGLFSAVQETEQALCQMNPDQLLRLRARMVLNDFRLSAEDKEQQK